MHYTQRERLKNLDMINGWVKGKDTAKINRFELIRKTVLATGCTSDKAKEYIDIVIGKEAE